VLLPSDTQRKLITPSRVVLLPFVTYLLSVVRWPDKNPVACLRCYPTKASSFPDQSSEDPLVASFNCLMPGVAAQYSWHFLFNYSLTLSLPAHGDTGIPAPAPRNRFIEPFQAVCILAAVNPTVDRATGEGYLTVPVFA
jgi:hypothetical protein